MIPGHGRIANEADVVEYRDMLTIIRDRVQQMTRQRKNAGAGDRGTTDVRLRWRVRREHRAVDDTDVRRGHLPEPLALGVPFSVPG